MVFFFSPTQSISAPTSGIWSEGKDKNDTSQAHTWNFEVFIDVVKEIVSAVTPAQIIQITVWRS